MTLNTVWMLLVTLTACAGCHGGTDEPALEPTRGGEIEQEAHEASEDVDDAADEAVDDAHDGVDETKR